MALSTIFDSFKKLKVLIIGDVMIDSYVYGKVSRISPEAPVPIVNVSKREKRLGGAANVALNIASLGAEPILCSIIGDDLEADIFLDLLKKSNISTRGIIKSEHRVTTVKNRILSGSQHMLRIDSESTKDLNPLEQKTMLQHIQSLIDESDLVIFEDYDKGCINPTLITETVAYARQKSVPVAVDPKKKNFMDYKGVTLFKPNLKELKEGLKIELEADDENGIEEAISSLQDKLNYQLGMVTLSEHGIYIAGDQAKHHIPAHKRSIADVSGAGDTVISIAGLCLALQLPPRFIAALANLGGGLVCEHLGVVPVDRSRLQQEAENSQLSRYL